MQRVHRPLTISLTRSWLIFDIYDISYDVTDIFVILDRYLTGGDGDGLVLMDWYEIEVGQRTAGNNHQYYIKIRFIFTLTRLTVAFYLGIFCLGERSYFA